MDRSRHLQTRLGEPEIARQGLDVGGSAMVASAEEAAIEGVLRGICYPDEIEPLVYDLRDEVDDMRLVKPPSKGDLKKLGVAEREPGRLAVNEGDSSDRIPQWEGSEYVEGEGYSNGSHDQARILLQAVKPGAPGQQNGSVLANVANLAKEASLKVSNTCDYEQGTMAEEERGEGGVIHKVRQSFTSLEVAGHGQNGGSVASDKICSESQGKRCGNTWNTRGDGLDEDGKSVTVDSAAPPLVDNGCCEADVPMELSSKEKGAADGGRVVGEVGRGGMDQSVEIDTMSKGNKVDGESRPCDGDVPSLIDSSGVSNSGKSAGKCGSKEGIVLGNLLEGHKREQQKSCGLETLPENGASSHVGISEGVEPGGLEDGSCRKNHPCRSSPKGEKRGKKQQQQSPEKEENSRAGSPISSVSSAYSEKKANSAPASVAGEAHGSQSKLCSDLHGKSWRGLAGVRWDGSRDVDKLGRLSGIRGPQDVPNARDMDVQMSFINSIRSISAQHVARDSRHAGSKMSKYADLKVSRHLEGKDARSLFPKRDTRHVSALHLPTRNDQQHPLLEAACGANKFDCNGRDSVQSGERRDRRQHEMWRSPKMNMDNGLREDQVPQRRVDKTGLVTHLVRHHNLESGQKPQSMGVKNNVANLMGSSCLNNELLLSNLGQHAQTGCRDLKGVRGAGGGQDWGLGKQAMSLLKPFPSVQKRNASLKDLDWGWEDNVSETSNTNQTSQVPCAVGTPDMVSEVEDSPGVNKHKIGMDILSKGSHSGGLHSSKSPSRVSGISELSGMGQNDAGFLPNEGSVSQADRVDKPKKKKKKPKSKQKALESSVASVVSSDEAGQSILQGFFGQGTFRHQLDRQSPREMKEADQMQNWEGNARDAVFGNYQPSEVDLSCAEGMLSPAQVDALEFNQTNHEPIMNSRPVKKKTKLSPYAAEYVKQADPYASEGLVPNTTPMVAHIRPLNSLLAELQRPQSAKPGHSSHVEQPLAVGSGLVDRSRLVEGPFILNKTCLSPKQSPVQQSGELTRVCGIEVPKRAMQSGAADRKDRLSSVPGDGRSTPSPTADFQSAQSSPTATSNSQTLPPGYSRGGPPCFNVTPNVEQIAPFLAPQLQPYWTTYYDLFCDDSSSTQQQCGVETDLWAGDFEGQEKQLAFARRCQPILREEYKEIIASSRHQWWRR